MQVPRSYIEGYSAALNAVDERAKKSLADMLARVDYDRPVAEVRAEVVAIMQRACGASAEVSARLAADFYDELRARFGARGDYDSLADPLLDPDATEGAVRAFAQDLVDGKPIEQFIAKCLSRIGYENRRAANECMALNARRDPAKPRWARVPVGAETCTFCLMLASRGFAYRSGSTASHAHDNCNCRVIPSFGGASVEDYDPDEYYEKWQDAIDRTAEERAERKGTDVASERERILDYYRNSSRRAKANRKNEWFFSGRDGMRGFESFRDVETYLLESGSKADLEHRYSTLANIYGTERLRNQRLRNAARHAQKRFVDE